MKKMNKENKVNEKLKQFKCLKCNRFIEIENSLCFFCFNKKEAIDPFDYKQEPSRFNFNKGKR